MAGNIIQAEIEIIGSRPFIFHAFTPEIIAGGRTERTGIAAGNDPSEWKKTVLYDPSSRQLYIPAVYVYSCFREAAKYTRNGRSTFQARISATLNVADEKIWFNNLYLPDDPKPNPDEPVYVDVRGVTNPATRMHNVRYRIAVKAGWSCGFRITWDRTIVPVQTMQSILNDAATLVGIGDGRTMGNGRFTIARYEICNGA